MGNLVLTLNQKEEIIFVLPDGTPIKLKLHEQCKRAKFCIVADPKISVRRKPIPQEFIGKV